MGIVFNVHLCPKPNQPAHHMRTTLLSLPIPLPSRKPQVQFLFCTPYLSCQSRTVPGDVHNIFFFWSNVHYNYNVQGSLASGGSPAITGRRHAACTLPFHQMVGTYCDLVKTLSSCAQREILSLSACGLFISHLSLRLCPAAAAAAST